MTPFLSLINLLECLTGLGKVIYLLVYYKAIKEYESTADEVNIEVQNKEASVV